MNIEYIQFQEYTLANYMYYALCIPYANQFLYSSLNKISDALVRILFCGLLKEEII